MRSPADLTYRTEEWPLPRKNRNRFILEVIPSRQQRSLQQPPRSWKSKPLQTPPAQTAGQGSQGYCDTSAPMHTSQRCPDHEGLCLVRSLPLMESTIYWNSHEGAPSIPMKAKCPCVASHSYLGLTARTLGTLDLV